ncbi:VOC family protein [Mycoplasma sp. P36-A1]|uniref:VOC family protein n=1 Tax=Mycoplasma sp. P36-A1 TaxID=3252900 RepID=UPI003C303066
MYTGVEIDFIVKDSLQAIKIYQSIFDVELLEKTNLEVGLNEVVFKIFNTRFHMLDENEEYHLHAPKPDIYMPIWFNVVVLNIEEVHKKALRLGCIEIQPIKEMKEYKVTNSMFKDEFGYLWMLHQIKE